MINTQSEELYFHGTKASHFESFEIGKLGSGEGAHSANGFYFATSLKGACNHAKRKAKQSSKPLVYVCTIMANAKVLTIDKPICEQPTNVQDLWGSLPVWISTLNSRDWFNNLAMTPESLINRNVEPLTERSRCDLLLRYGFDVLRHYENGAFVDDYLHGSSHLVINPKVINVEEILDVETLHEETCGSARNYCLKSERALLGGTNVMSKLRRC